MLLQNLFRSHSEEGKVTLYYNVLLNPYKQNQVLSIEK